MAIESFAIEPDDYFELMKRVEIFLKRQSKLDYIVQPLSVLVRLLFVKLSIFTQK